MSDLERAKNALCPDGRALLNDAMMAADRFGGAGHLTIRAETVRIFTAHAYTCDRCRGAVTLFGAQVGIDRATGRDG